MEIVLHYKGGMNLGGRKICRMGECDSKDLLGEVRSVSTCCWTAVA